MSATVAIAVEMVTFAPESRRATDLFAALRAGARGVGVEVTATTTYRGVSPWMLVWGPGHPARAAVIAQHVAAGGHALCWDLAYWHRDTKARVSIDAAHPSAWVMRTAMPASRFAADRVPVASTWNPKGAVIVAGLGDKARVQYGAHVVDAWERSMIAQCRARWPNRPVVYRKKKTMSPVPAEVDLAPMTPIDQALSGTSLVVTWHSNVAVDAIRMGIPVICRDGAAAAVCPSALGDIDPQPLSLPVRDQFLANLAWFQWAPSEAPAFWNWAQERLS